MLASALLLFAAAAAGQTVLPPPSPPAIAEQAQGGMLEIDDTVNQTVLVERQIMIRVPASRNQSSGFLESRRSRPIANQVPVQWREVKAPRCIPARSILGVQYVQRSSIELITRERQRLRAALNRDCRAVDFYSGFYVAAAKDGQICADRDVLHARSGARCDVQKFSYVVPTPMKR